MESSQANLEDLDLLPFAEEDTSPLSVHRALDLANVEVALFFGQQRIVWSQQKRDALLIMKEIVAPRVARGKRAHVLGEDWLCRTYSLTPSRVKKAKRELVSSGCLKVWKQSCNIAGRTRPAVYVVTDFCLREYWS